jgi:hypothetical protein
VSTKSFRKTRLSELCISRIGFALLLAAARWPAAGATSASAAQIQQVMGEKLVEVESHHRDDAVAITKVTVGDRELECGLIVSRSEVQPVTPFLAADDWLQTMTIYLYNRTNKTIVAGQIVLGFPETGDGHTQPQRVYLIDLGRVPEAAAFSGRTGQPIALDPRLKPISFLPGQTLLIHVGDYIDRIRDDVQDLIPLTMITKCAIRRSHFFFDDAMRWDIGGFAVPDPEHPGRFKRLDGNYFPGRKTWPPGYHN